MERTRQDASETGDPDEPQEAVQVQVKGQATCPLCLDPLTTLPRLEVCAACRTIHHTSCVDEFGRCGTPACQGLARRTGPAAPAGAGDEHERAIAAVAHIAATFGGTLLVPLGIWYFTRERQPFAAHHAWRAFVFSLASIPLSVVTLGLWVPVMLVLSVRAALRSWRGGWVPYGRAEQPGSRESTAPTAATTTSKSIAKT